VLSICSKLIYCSLWCDSAPAIVKSDPAQRLLARVARLYYEQDLTQQQIARRLRLSRQKIQRMLKVARSSGVVRISITPVVGEHTDLEEALEERFGLREAVVVETPAPDDQAAVSRQVGAAGAEYVARVLRDGDRVVISWGGTIAALVDALAYRSGPGTAQDVTVVQGLGGLGDPGHETHASDLTRRMARALRGTAVLLPAPGVAGSREARDALCADPQVKLALDHARRATLAVMGIGAPRRDSILDAAGDDRLVEGAARAANWRRRRRRHQPALLRCQGRPRALCDRRPRDRADARGAARHPARRRLGGGPTKFDAIAAALAGKLVHVLITDHATAAKATRDPRRRGICPKSGVAR
jgi:DNA-binding transcriptional regulator LsrR (DeoR family)